MSENETTFAERLRSGETLIGTLLALNSPEIAETLAGVGYDWLFIDAEHGPFLPQDTLPMLQAAAPCPCVIRIPAIESIWVNKALDIGAAGIIVPKVNTAKDAENIIKWAKYTPDGDRGLGLGRAHEYGLSYQETLTNANRETAVILQAETKRAVENIDMILSVKGIDAILIGPNDLAASYGKLGQLTDPVVTDAIQIVHEACQKAGVQTGFFGATAEAVQPYMDMGFNLITVGVDSLFLINSASQTLGELRD